MFQIGTGNGRVSGLASRGMNLSGIGSNFVQLFGVPLVADGNYTLTFTLANATAFTGNGTLYPNAVPEPGTSAMMLLGLSRMGLALCRKRRPVLAQIA